jgi:hypothetical protein
MSSWTEVLLAATLLEDISPEDAPSIFPAVEHINSWLRENRYGELFLIDHPTRQAPNACFAGSFNHLDITGFIEAVKSAPWEWSEQVQLLLRQEDDHGFQEIAWAV